MIVDQDIDYYYGEQIRTVINQFAQVFSELYVTVGKNDNNSENNYVRIPIVYGSPDKVVTAIKNEHTQNKMLRVPMFSIVLDGITIPLDRKSGTNTDHRRTVFPLGGDIKKDTRALYRSKAFPYTFQVSVVAYTSNTDQMFQITEQLLLLFDPLLQFQTSDSPYDWVKVIDAEMTSVDINENRNPENDGRFLQTTFGFDVLAYISPPANLKDNIIRKINMRIEAIAGRKNTEKYVKDVGRPTPEYTVVYDIDNEVMPKS